jgi:hypothetical protein
VPWSWSPAIAKPSLRRLTRSSAWIKVVAFDLGEHLTRDHLENEEPPGKHTRLRRSTRPMLKAKGSGLCEDNEGCPAGE